MRYRYVLRRIALLLPTLLGTTMVIFVLVRLIPGNTADAILGAGAANVTHQSKQALEHSLGLDQSLPTAYVSWLGAVLQGNLGQSLITGQSVTSILGSALPITLELSIFALIVASLAAVPLGVYAATRRNTRRDFAARTGSLVGLSVPDFWLATLVLLFTSVVFHWTPGIIWTPITANPVVNLEQVAIPGGILSVFLIATTMRMTRTAMLDVLSQDYMRTGRAKGLSRRRLVYVHALRNALIPVITLAGVQAAGLISGATILETVFGLPGVGYTLTQAIFKRDYPVVEGTVLILAVLVVVVNLVVDVLYGLVDPRVSE